MPRRRPAPARKRRRKIEPDEEIRPVRFERGELVLLDQRKLPHVERLVRCRSATATANAIRSMVVRGAPAIGLTAAYGLAVAAKKFRAGRVREDFERAATVLLAARPTAVNLAWAVDRMRRLLATLPIDASPREAALALEREASTMLAADIAVNRSLGRYGAPLIPRRGGVLTHCNAGALATAGYGTAVGVIRAAHENGRRIEAFATETRPYLQGARLTVWELTKLGIPVTLLTDSMVGRLFQSGCIGCVVVGTDRTAANGDVANKIGTYPIAVLARRHGIPFFVAAPTSSIDLDCPDGSHIPIEERDEREVTHVAGRRIAATGVSVFNPAFDVTPAELVTAIITEHGVAHGRYRHTLRKLVAKSRVARPA